MPNRRIVIQPPIEVAGVAGVPNFQEVRFAVPTSGAKSGLLWINVMKNTSTSTVTFDLYGATSLSLLDSGSGSFWKTIVSGAAPTVTTLVVGAFNAPLTNIADFARWRVSGISAPGTIQFELIAYLYDT